MRDFILRVLRVLEAVAMEEDDEVSTEPTAVETPAVAPAPVFPAAITTPPPGYDWTKDNRPAGEGEFFATWVDGGWVANPGPSPHNHPILIQAFIGVNLRREIVVWIAENWASGEAWDAGDACREALGRPRHMETKAE